MPQNEYIERFQKQHGKRYALHSIYFLANEPVAWTMKSANVNDSPEKAMKPRTRRRTCAASALRCMPRSVGKKRYR